MMARKTSIIDIKNDLVYFIKLNGFQIKTGHNVVVDDEEIEMLDKVKLFIETAIETLDTYYTTKNSNREFEYVKKSLITRVISLSNEASFLDFRNIYNPQKEMILRSIQNYETLIFGDNDKLEKG